MILAMDSVDLNPMDTLDGRKPLLWAASRENKEIVESLLVKDGISPDAKDNKGQTPRW
jgi:ankyrin repeat protein